MSQEREVQFKVIQNLLLWREAKIGTVEEQTRQSESPLCNFLILYSENIITILLNLVTVYTLIELKFMKLLSIQDEVEE